MADEYPIPKPQAPLLLSNGCPTNEWWNYWNNLLLDAVGADYQEQINALLAMIQALQSETFSLSGPGSVLVTGANGNFTVQLVNDSASPGLSFYYGTDDSGDKNWYPIIDPFVDYLVDQDGNYLTDQDGNFLVSDSGSTGNFWRGDRSWSDTIEGDLFSSGPSAALFFQDRTGATSDNWGWYATANKARLFRAGDLFTFDPLGRMEFLGNTSSDSRTIYSSGAGSPTKAATTNFTTGGGRDAAGIWSVQRRTTSDGYEQVLLEIELTSQQTTFYGGLGPGADNAQSIGSALYRWSNLYAQAIRPGAGAVIWTSGTGTPEGVVTAPVGSMFTRTDGGAGTTLYIKESGAGNTGWVGK